MRLTTKLLALGTFVLFLGASSGHAQQVEEENLPEVDIWEEIIPTYVEAEKVFNSRNQPDSLALFDEFLRQVEVARALEEPPAEIHQLVANSYFYRAQVAFNIGDTEVVQADLERLLQIEPGFAMDRTLVSSKFADLFDEIKARTVGSVLFAVSPPDARISAGPWEANADGMLLLPIGTHSVTIERPGYSSVAMQVEAKASEVPTLEVELERTDAVLTILTEMEDVEIFVDGESRGFTSTPQPGEPGREALLVLDGLQPGAYELAAGKEGYREYLARARIEDLRDYVVGPITLEPTAGVVVLSSFPAGTVVRANGELVSPDFDAGPEPRVTLSPGDYRLALSHPDLGLFETMVTVRDQETTEVRVRLRPPLILLGVLGGDETSAQRMQGLLEDGLGDLASWALIDRSGAASRVLEAADTGVETLRMYAQTGSRESIPWARIQEEADARAKGALYLLAVLSDDLLAERAHIFVLPEAPLPSRPDVLDIALEEQDVERLAGLLDSSVFEERPAVGAVLVDTPVAEGPLVVHVSEKGAATTAGLTPGDRITAVEGEPVASVNDFHAALESRAESHGRTGSALALQVVSAQGERREVPFGFTTSPVLLRPRDAEVLYSAAASKLAAEVRDTDSIVPAWVVKLDLATVYLHGGDLEAAIRTLREVSAPEGDRLGEGQVSYLLGVALNAAGGEYVQTAKGFLEEAAQKLDARLYHSDGPFIAPRARARLRVLN